MSLIELPEPPYWSVTFTSLRTPGDDGYAAMGERMAALAATQPGYLGAQSWRNAEGLGITVSYWRSDTDIAAWKRNADHQIAQAAGRAQWYAAYRVEIAQVRRAYAFTSATVAP